jgi:hypothetical protein
MGEITREELSAMTDQELLAYEREHHGDPYRTLATAKALRHPDLPFWHIGEAGKKADREAHEEARRRLHQKLFPSDSAVLEPKRGQDRKSAMTAARSPGRAY